VTVTFLPTTPAQRIIPGSGPANAKIAIVGEAGGAYENIQLKPFVGPAGGVLEQCLHAAGLIRSDVYLTNVVKIHPTKNDISPYFDSRTGVFTDRGMEWVRQLRVELNELAPNLIVACGATALAALTCQGTRGQPRITKYRGYLMLSHGLEPERKVLAMIHPAASLRGQYVLRHLIAADLKKAKIEGELAELARPQRQLVYEYGSVEEVLEWLAYFEEQSIVCFDIEVLNYELACIGFSSNPNIACSIPLVGQWSEQDELQIWRGLQRVLGNPNSIKVAQNGIFDIHFLLTKAGIEVRGPLRDTMIAHHIMYPELQKGLGFLVSIYGGSQQYYKDMIKFDNIKGES
jgi:uracil-DNA glycosylase